MTSPAITALVAHVRRVPAPERQTLLDALTAARSPGVLLSTCHRVELYASNPSPAVSKLMPPGAEVLHGEAAVRHAIATAVGLDSVVIGEDQILHQMRAALAAARAQRDLGPGLERLFALALRAGRRARSWRRGRAPSLADVALAEIERRTGALAHRRVLVVGAGDVARLAVAAAVAAGADVTIASRTDAHAAELAGRFRVNHAPFDPGPESVDFDAAVVALRGQWILGSSTIDRLAKREALLIDLSMPIAVPATLAASLGERFISSDALATAQPPAAAYPSAERASALVDETVRDYMDWLEKGRTRDAASALTTWADAERQAELDQLWRRLPALPPDARHAIDAMSRHLAERILREPLERLGRDADGRAEQATRDLFAL